MALTKIKIGDKFGRLTVIDFAGHERSKNGQSKLLVKCVCDHGGNTNIPPHIGIYRACNLTRGDTKSCGCLKIEKQNTVPIGNKYGMTHGYSNEKLYGKFTGMKQRCYNPNSTNYDKYGGRGIYICDEWMIMDKNNTGYLNFRKWAHENGYTEESNLEINRINNDGPYSPDNCEITDRTTQMNNTSVNNTIEWNGKSHTVAQWANIIGINRNTLENRLFYDGWDIDRIMTEKPIRNITYITNSGNGDTFSIANWCYITGLPQSTISSRLERLKDKNSINTDNLFKPGRLSKINAIYFVDEEGYPISEEDYNNGKRIGRKDFE